MKRAGDFVLPQRTSLAAHGSVAGQMPDREKHWIIDQLGPRAQTMFSADESGAMFKGFLASLVNRQRNIFNPRERQDGFTEWLEKIDKVNDKVEYHKVVINALGDEGGQRFTDPFDAKKFGLFIIREGGDPTDPGEMKRYFPTFPDQRFVSCRETMKRAFGDNLAAKFTDVLARMSFHDQMCKNNLHAGSSDQELHDLYERRVAQEFLTVPSSSHRPLGDRVASKIISERRPRQAPRRKRDLRDEIQDLRKDEAPRVNPGVETPPIAVERARINREFATDKARTMILSLLGVGQHEFRGKQGDRAFRAFLDYLTKEKWDLTDERQVRKGFAEWSKRGDVLRDKSRYHGLVIRTLGEEGRERFKLPADTKKFGKFIQNTGDSPADEAAIRRWFPKFHDQSYFSCVIAMRDAFPQDFGARFPDDRTRSVFVQMMRKNDLHAKSPGQDLRNLYRRNAEKEAAGAKVLAGVARQHGVHREFSKAELSVYFAMMTKKGEDLEDPKAAAVVLPEFFRRLSQLGARDDRASLQDPSEPDQRDESRDIRKGETPRVKPRVETPPVTVESERINRALAAEKKRIVNQLGGVAGDRLGGKYSDEAFQAFQKFLVETSRDAREPGQLKEGFIEWHAKGDVVNNMMDYQRLLNAADLGEEARQRFSDPVEAQKFGRFIRSKGGDPSDPAKMKLHLKDFHDWSWPACLRTMRRAFGQDFDAKFTDHMAQRSFHNYMCVHDVHAGSKDEDLRALYEQRRADSMPAAKVLAEVAARFFVTREFTDTEVYSYIGMLLKRGVDPANRAHAAKHVPDFLGAAAAALHKRNSDAKKPPAYGWGGAQGIGDWQAARAPRKRLASRSPTNLSPVRKKSVGGRSASSEHDQQIQDEFERESRRSPFAQISPVRKKSAGGRSASSEHDQQIQDEFERESRMSPFAQNRGNAAPVPLERGPIPLGRDDIGLDFDPVSQTPPAWPLPERTDPFPQSPNADWPMGTPEAASPRGTPEGASPQRTLERAAPVPGSPAAGSPPGSPPGSPSGTPPGSPSGTPEIESEDERSSE